MRKNWKKQGGYTLLEIVFYICFFAILSTLVINAMILMTRSFRETTIQSQLIQGGNIMERISREIKQADSINTISSTDLKLNTKDEAGADKTVEFLLSGSDVQILENDVLTGNLNPESVSVSSLDFTEITTTKSKAVKIILTVSSENDLLNRNEVFYDTVVLRGSY